MLQNRELRRIVLTLAWSTPIDPTSVRYRGLALDIVDREGKRGFWNGVAGAPQPHPFATRRGTVQHLVLEGTKMMQAAEDGFIFIGVQARAAIAAFADEDVPYALAVTLEVAQSVREDLAVDVAARVRPRTPIRERTPTRIRTRR